MCLRVQYILLDLILLSFNFVIMVNEPIQLSYVPPVVECVIYCSNTLMQASGMISDGIDAPSFGDASW